MIPYNKLRALIDKYPALQAEVQRRRDIMNSSPYMAWSNRNIANGNSGFTIKKKDNDKANQQRNKTGDNGE
jgi:hypothetical protein